MARTRGASLVHADDGELLDKEGNPIPVEALMSPETALAALAESPSVVEAEPPLPTPDPVYRCDVTTCQRNLGGWELIRILDLMLGGMSVDLGVDAWSKLPPDVRMHFRRIA